MRLKAGPYAEIMSAGTIARGPVNDLAVKVTAEIGGHMEDAYAKPLEDEWLKIADRVVVMSSAAEIDESLVQPGNLERWGIDEPHERGIEGAQRMRLIRDDIELHVNQLITDLELDTVD